MNFDQGSIHAKPAKPWDGDHLEEGTGDWAGWLDQHSKAFNAGVDSLKTALQAAFDELSKNPSNPKALADYQTKLSEYNMYRMLQSNSSKTLADMQKQNIRNIA
jgi:type III secretion protein F